MLKPLEQWICDVCGEVIENPASAIVAWNVDSDGIRYGFRIVHQVQCDARDDNGWLHISSLLGPDGLTRLLSFLADGPIVGIGKSYIRNVDEFVDLVRRCQLPHYEGARAKFHLDSAREALNDPTSFHVSALIEIAADDFE